MPIDATTFGAITINGKTYDHDVIIRLSGAVEKRRKRLSKEMYGTSHIVSKAEAKFVFEDDCELLIVGAGQGWKRALVSRGKRVFRQEALSGRVAADAGGHLDLQQVAAEKEGCSHPRDVLRRTRPPSLEDHRPSASEWRQCVESSHSPVDPRVASQVPIAVIHRGRANPGFDLSKLTFPPKTTSPAPSRTQASPTLRFGR